NLSSSRAIISKEKISRPLSPISSGGQFSNLEESLTLSDIVQDIAYLSNSVSSIQVSLCSLQKKLMDMSTEKFSELIQNSQIVSSKPAIQRVENTEKYYSPLLVSPLKAPKSSHSLLIKPKELVCDQNSSIFLPQDIPPKNYCHSSSRVSTQPIDQKSSLIHENNLGSPPILCEKEYKPNKPSEINNQAVIFDKDAIFVPIKFSAQEKIAHIPLPRKIFICPTFHAWIIHSTT
ncbi:hypothetical protein MXB_4357, partial [Myxobolus squamalis]